MSAVCKRMNGTNLWFHKRRITGGLYGRTEQRIPGALLWLGSANGTQYRAAQESGESLPGLHSPRFAPDARPTIETGVKAMSAVLLELFRKQ